MNLETKPAIDFSAFDIDPITNLVVKCPGGHAPRHTGISKGQTAAHFSVETCVGCMLREACPSKQQAKDFTVRISLKALETGGNNERTKPGNIAAIGGRAQDHPRSGASGFTDTEKPGRLGVIADRASAVISNGFKDGPVPFLKRYGIATAVAIACMIVIITTPSRGLFSSSDETLQADAAEELAEQVSSAANDNDSNIYPLIDTETIAGPVLETQYERDRIDAVGSYDSSSPTPSASAQVDDIAANPALSEDDDTPESSDPAAENEDAESGPADGEAPVAAAPVVSGAQTAVNTSPAPRQQLPEQSASTSGVTDLPYLIYVSKNSFTIAILGLDEYGNYTQLVRTFSTAIGRSSAQTRAGTYKITTRERWRDWGGIYTPYATKHSGGLFFHGPIFTEKDSYKLRASSYNEIGSTSTSGCMRTYTAAAAWIYYNCAEGTTVIIANDSMYTSSPPAKLDESQLFDPTDPDILIEAPEEPPIITFTLSHSIFELHSGDTFTLEPTAVSPDDADMTSLTYSSDDDSIAAIAPNGVVTAGVPGTATITATIDGAGGTPQTCTVIVTAPVIPPPPDIGFEITEKTE